MKGKEKVMKGGVPLSIKPVLPLVYSLISAESLHDAPILNPQALPHDCTLAAETRLPHEHWWLQMCVHNGPTIDPDLRDASQADDADEKCVGEMISKHFPGIEDKPSIRETCIYTVSAQGRGWQR